MSSRRKCCVPGCETGSTKGHRIPRDALQREVWFQRIGNAALLEKEEESLMNLQVCDAHFDTQCVYPSSGRVRPGALPTLKLPGYRKVPNDNFLLPVEPRARVYFRTPEKISQGMNNIGESSTAASRSCSPELSVLRPIRVYEKRLHIGSTMEEEPYCEKLRRLSAQPGPSGIGAEPQRGEKVVLATPSLVAVSSTSRQRQRKHCTFQKRTRKYRYVPRIVTIPKGMNVFKKKVQQLNEADTFREQLKKLKNIPLFDELQHVNSTTFQFIMSQIRDQRFKPRGRRFTLDDKIFALSAYKQSPKGYRYLSKFFSLPCRKTLSNLLGTIPLHCGINPHLFEHLRGVVSELKELDRYCALMFDEISLNPGLHYNIQEDRVEGVVDYGNGDRRRAYADHALVFMVKGIRKSWKQPICFYFCESSTPTAHLVTIIKDVIRHVRQTGLEVVATICDQGSTNCSAVNYLLNETARYHSLNNLENRLQGYLVDGKEVVHFFDPPHLLKGIRNALLTRDLHFRQDGRDKVASWNHIVRTFRMEGMRDNLQSMIASVTEEHVIPSKIRKMRVRNCTQVFSQRMSAALSIRADIGKRLLAARPADPLPDWCLEPSGQDTADLVSFLDQLFDSVNGLVDSESPLKKLRKAVTVKTTHVTFWQSAIPILKSMRFLPSPGRPGGAAVTPSLKNFIFTLRSFLYTWSLLKDRGFTKMRPRSFNQDPLENFFSLIRSHGARNTNPTCTSFAQSFKSLVLNNFTGSHSPVANCEKDNCKALDTLKKLCTSMSSGSEGMFSAVRLP